MFLNCEMGRAFVRGYHEGGILCCVKHFAAYGAAEAGRDYNTTDVSVRNLKEYYLPAYRACVEEGADLVMSSFNLLNGIPVNGHRELLVDTLRDEWGFDGVLISDYGAVTEMIVHGYLESEKECAETAIRNGLDMEMMSPTYIRHLPELVKEGKVSQKLVDESLRRVLEMKEKAGLFENRYGAADPQKAEEVSLSPEHRAIARRAAVRSAVLLKNEGVLPLSEDREFALAGPFAEEKYSRKLGVPWPSGRGGQHQGRIGICLRQKPCFGHRLRQGDLGNLCERYPGRPCKTQRHKYGDRLHRRTVR